MSLEKNNYKNYRVIVVDNGSNDNSYDKLSYEFINKQNVQLLKTYENIGFAGGNNFGIKYSIAHGAKIFLLLNNDTEVDEDFLVKLMEGWDQKSIRVPRINFYKNKSDTWYSSGYFDRNRCLGKNGYSERDCCVTFVTGCCMLLSKAVVDCIGFLDESFFMYCEDLDYSLRAANLNVNMYYISNSLIYHKVGQSSGGERSKFAIYYNNRNRFYLIKKYNMSIVSIFYTALTRALRFITSIIVRNNDRIILEAYLDFRKGIKGKKDGI